MKKTILAIAALAFMAWGCSSSDDNDDTKPVEPVENKTVEPGTDSRPDWQNPNFDNYENVMTIEVTLQNPLQEYASAADMMCVTINNEVRGVADAKQVDDTWTFMLHIGANEVGAEMSLSYYCDKLHRIFTTPWTTFDTERPPFFDMNFQGDANAIYRPSFI